jgi:hypothetical protein
LIFDWFEFFNFSILLRSIYSSQRSALSIICIHTYMYMSLMHR